MKYLLLLILAASEVHGGSFRSPETLEEVFSRVARKEHVDAKLLKSLCWIESKHKPFALNKSDGGSPSYGICQIKIGTARFVGFKGSVDKLWKDVETNITYAAKYLKWQKTRYKGDKLKAIAAYNAGHYKPNTNTRYITKVFNKYYE